MILNWLLQKLSWIKNKINKKVEKPCSTCVWWASEEENGLKAIPEAKYKFCDIHKDFTKNNHSCTYYLEELFEATSESSSTPELEINHNLEIEGNNQDGREK